MNGRVFESLSSQGATTPPDYAVLSSNLHFISLIWTTNRLISPVSTLISSTSAALARSLVAEWLAVVTACQDRHPLWKQKNYVSRRDLEMAHATNGKELEVVGRVEKRKRCRSQGVHGAKQERTRSGSSRTLETNGRNTERTPNPLPHRLLYNPLAASTRSLSTASLPIFTNHRMCNRVAANPESHLSQSQWPVQSDWSQNLLNYLHYYTYNAFY